MTHPYARPSRLRVLYLTGQLGLGGAERQLYFLATGLDPSRYAVQILTLNPGKGDFWERELSAANLAPVPIPPGGFPARSLRIRRAVRPWRPDIIHCWNLFTSAYGLAARFPFRTPVIAGVRFWPTRRNVESLPGGAARKLFLKGVDALVCNSEAANWKLGEAFGNLPPRFAIPNGVRIPEEAERADLAAAAARALGRNPGETWIGFVGSLIPRKNVSLLLEAVASLAPDWPDLRLAVVGEGPLREALGVEALERGIGERVRFLGPVPAAEHLMPGFDVFCLPSHAEGMANVLMEAAAAGRPVVATDVSAASEIVRDGETGYLTAPGDAADLASRLRSLLQDRERRESFGEAGRQLMLKSYGVPSMIERYDDLYRRLAGMERS